MKTRDILWLGYRGLTDRKVRAMLTILMVVIGVASIISLVSQTTGIQASINSSLFSLGPTSINVAPSQSTQLTDADVARLETIPGVDSVVPIVTSAAQMVSAGQSTPISVIGVSSGGLASLIGKVNLFSGSLYPDNSAPIALTGYNVAFPQSSGGKQSIFLGQPIVLQQVFAGHLRTLSLSVGGVLQLYGSTSFIPIDSSIFVSLDAAKTLFHRSSYNEILVKANSTSFVNTVAQFISDVYGSSVSVTTIQQISQTVSTITGQIGILLGAIAGISLTVAAIGIMNIMFVSVLEKTRQIGIFKALGFKDRHVLLVFLSQAVIIGMIGGIVGIGVGSGVSYILPLLFTGFGSTRGGATSTSRTGGGGGGFGFGGGGEGAVGGGGGFTLSYTPIIAPEIVIISFVVATIVSIIAGLYPAWRASKMEPINALRYE